jgi:hypothetical protein
MSGSYIEEAAKYYTLGILAGALLMKAKYITQIDTHKHLDKSLGITPLVDWANDKSAKILQDLLLGRITYEEAVESLKRLDSEMFGHVEEEYDRRKKP